MIEQGCFTNGQIADDNDCRIGAVKAIKRNIRDFGSIKAPGRRGGRPSSITPEIRDALLAHLEKNPELYLEEMMAYLQDEFGVCVTRFSVSRALRSARWSKKKFRRKAVEQNLDLVDYYLHSISSFHSYQFVFVDESGSDNRDGFRRTGWSPRGVTPV
jgi:transposase